MSSLQSDYPTVPKSITNPNVQTKDALDYNSPLSFLTFIKIIDTSYNPSSIQEYYNFYLKEWNKQNSEKEQNEQSLIVERYREFIQDINLNYLTIEEQKFLEQLDFSDPLDLDVAIPFYSKKLIEIANYYNIKREETKFQITKNQIKGTNFGISKELTELTLNYLKNLENSEILYNFQNIKDNLEVEIEELYETYPKYFNQTPDDTIYDNKDLDYGLDVFLRNDSDLITEVFANVSDNLKKLKESDQLFENKRKLTEKYLGSDYYFLSTGNTVYDFVSGKAIDTAYPISNFLNKNYPTTASTNRKQYITPDEIGYFRPHKTSIILIDGNQYSFSFNFEKLEPNTIYYFPDPFTRSNNSDILSFTTSDLDLKRNDSSGNAKNQPTSEKNDSKYYGYISNIELPSSKYLDDVFESGYIQDAKSDIYNNLYGLFKNDGSFSQTIVTTENEFEYFQILNGHTFYDFTYGEGYAFDYSTFDDSTLPYTTRSGLSTNTASLSTDFSRFYTIFGGKFVEKDFYYPPDYLPKYQVLDGVFIFDDDMPYVDTISSDLSAYPDSGSFYYSKLIEGGVHTTSPLQRALVDASYPTITADATQEVIPDGVTTFMIDGGKINTKFEDISFDLPHVYYDPTVIETSIYSISSTYTNTFYDRYQLVGGIYVRNSYDKTVLKIEDALSYFSSTFPLSVYNEILSGVNSFEIVNDVLFIETENNFITTKIEFSNGVFTNPKTTTYTIKHQENPFQKLSKRFKKDDKVLYAVLNVEEYPPTSNNFKIYPTIYEFNTTAYTRKIHIPDISTNFYYVTGGDTTYVKAEPPSLTYNKRKNIYSVSFLLKDASNYFSLHEFDFKMNPFEMVAHNQYKQK